jgi:rRNA maturation protein Nop10
MAKVCPVCNGLTAVTASCPRCGRRLADGGALENYYGPYSPYMDVDSLQEGAPDTQCVHLLYCPACGYDTRAAWELVAL